MGYFKDKQIESMEDMEEWDMYEALIPPTLVSEESKVVAKFLDKVGERWPDDGNGEIAWTVGDMDCEYCGNDGFHIHTWDMGPFTGFKLLEKLAELSSVAAKALAEPMKEIS